MWIISIACWGEYYRHKFLHIALPSINAALRLSGSQATFFIHTDNEDSLCGAEFAGEVIFYKFEGRSDALYQSYGSADRKSLEMAPEDCYILFCPSDVVVNVELFANAERKFAEGRRAIVGHAARTLVAPEDCPAGLSARQLLDWSFSRERRHPVTEGCFFGRGRNLVAWCTYFEGPHGTIAHCFHQHPFCVVNDRYLWFNRETVDLDLLERFERDEIYVACDPNEFAFAEISGLEKTIPQLPAPVSVGSIVAWARHHSTPLQRWLFSHRILVQGVDEDHLDEAPCEDILSLLKAMG